VTLQRRATTRKVRRIVWSGIDADLWRNLVKLQSRFTVLNVIELNNMTPDMTLSGAANGPEPN
jgi:hypothetical protein